MIYGPMSTMTRLLLNALRTASQTKASFIFLQKTDEMKIEIDLSDRSLQFAISRTYAVKTIE